MRPAPAVGSPRARRDPRALRATSSAPEPLASRVGAGRGRTGTTGSCRPNTPGARTQPSSVGKGAGVSAPRRQSVDPRAVSAQPASVRNCRCIRTTRPSAHRRRKWVACICRQRSPAIRLGTSIKDLRIRHFGASADPRENSGSTPRFSDMRNSGHSPSPREVHPGTTPDADHHWVPSKPPSSGPSRRLMPVSRSR